MGIQRSGGHDARPIESGLSCRLLSSRRRKVDSVLTAAIVLFALLLGALGLVAWINKQLSMMDDPLKPLDDEE